MSLLEPTFASSSSLQFAGPRKRTSSFSVPNATFSPSPRPSKVPRTNMGSVHHTESFTTIPGIQNDQPMPSSSQPSPQQPDPSSVPYCRTLRFYKEQRERRKALNRHITPITIRTRLQVTHSESDLQRHVPQPISTPSLHIAAPQNPLPKPAPSQLRSSSPLAPIRTLLPGRPVFPRSKPEPDLYRKAITTRMRCTPEGQKILHMGPRLAVSIITATRELERIVAAQTQMDQPNDVTMGDVAPVLSNSWVVVPGEDWEMVDCGA